VEPSYGGELESQEHDRGEWHRTSKAIAIMERQRTANGMTEAEAIKAGYRKSKQHMKND
jgi:hypothetical protein